MQHIRSKDLWLIFLLTSIFLFVPDLDFNKYILEVVFFILLFLFSGYSLISLLRPEESYKSLTRKPVLILEFSILLILFISLILKFSLLGFHLRFLIMGLSILTMGFSLTAYIRRIKVLEDEKFHEKFDDSSLSNKTNSKKDSKSPIDTSEIVKEEFNSEKISKHSFVSKDLLLIFLTTLLAITFILTPKLNDTFIRTILGLFLVLFIPSYSLIAVLFPKKDDLEGVERAALSFGLSIAVTPLIGLALNYTPWGIRLTPILISLSAFTIIMVLIAYLRRRRVSEDEKFYINFGGFSSSIKSMFKGIFRGESKTSKLLSIILIILIILAISTTVYIIVKPKQGETFNEFYLLGPGGKLSDYPTNLTVGQNATVIIGIVNHEYQTVDYHLVVTSNGVVISEKNITLTEGNKTEIPIGFRAGTVGTKKIEFLLYKMPDNTNIYRSLHLYVVMD